MAEAQAQQSAPESSSVSLPLQASPAATTAAGKDDARSQTEAETVTLAALMDDDPPTPQETAGWTDAEDFEEVCSQCDDPVNLFRFFIAHMTATPLTPLTTRHPPLTDTRGRWRAVRSRRRPDEVDHENVGRGSRDAGFTPKRDDNKPVLTALREEDDEKEAPSPVKESADVDASVPGGAADLSSSASPASTSRGGGSPVAAAPAAAALAAAPPLEIATVSDEPNAEPIDPTPPATRFLGDCSGCTSDCTVM